MFKIWVQDSLSASDTVKRYSWNWDRFYADLVQALENGTAPDVVEIGNTWIGRLVQEGRLLDITAFAAERLDAASTFLPRILRYCTDPVRINRYFALPLLADVRVLFYNGEYLAAHPNAFRSWESFEQTCRAIRDQRDADRQRNGTAGRLEHVIAWPVDRDAFHYALPWIWAAGGDVISTSGEVLIDSDRTREAILRLARLMVGGYTPSPGDLSDHGVETLRLRFSHGEIAIIAGGGWMTHQGWDARFKATLYPPDPFPAAFIGGSALAIVRKHAGDEDSAAYQPAKDFVKDLVTPERQVKLAEGTGKLPCNLTAWRQLQQKSNKQTRPILDVFDRAIFGTVDRDLPNVPKLMWIEAELKEWVAHLWEEISHAKRPSTVTQPGNLDELIDEKLKEIRRRLEELRVGSTVRYTQRDVAKLGITPPGNFDLWVEVQMDAKSKKVRGSVYTADNPHQPKALGWVVCRLLLALVEAPQRALDQHSLLEKVWNYRPVSNKDLNASLTSIVKGLDSLVEGMNRSGHIQIDTVQHLKSLCEEIIYAQEDYDKNIDKLQENMKNLAGRLGTVRGIDIIRVENQQYFLDHTLSICVVE